MSTDAEVEAVYRFLEAQVRIRVVPEPTLPGADLTARWLAQWEQWSAAISGGSAVSGGSAAGAAGQLRSRPPVNAGDYSDGDGGGSTSSNNSSNSASAGGSRGSSLSAPSAMQQLSSSPPIWHIRNFLSVDECAALVAAGTARLGSATSTSFLPFPATRSTAEWSRRRAG